MLPTSSHLHRWMLFVDGENFAIRGQEVAKQRGQTLTPGKYYQRDVFLWFALRLAGQAPPFNETNTDRPWPILQPTALRSFYYTSVQGDDDRIKSVREALWRIGFQPEVFKREAKARHTKGVDIALATDFLSHAFLGNYDAAVLVAGDGDYIPMVREVKRLGKVVMVAFFSDPGAGLNAELKLAADRYIDLWNHFHMTWREADPGSLT